MMLTYNVIVSHRQGRMELNDLSESECNVIQSVINRSTDCRVLKVSPGIKKPVLITRDGKLDAMHIPNANIDKNSKHAISCLSGDDPAEQPCAAFPCSYPMCLDFKCSKGNQR